MIILMTGLLVIISFAEWISRQDRAAHREITTGADPGGVQGVRTPALLFVCPFFSYVDNSNINGRSAYLLS